MLFETAVEGVLAALEGKLDLPGSELREELQKTTAAMGNFGRMAELPSLVQLCESISGYLWPVPLEQVSALAQAALALWRDRKPWCC
ncbi:MAG: hypothetical protein HC890_17360 [Chloroflexaceae bacterium]|nr:hypothetical protein [Chloroflexaceae bacterium]